MRSLTSAQRISGATRAENLCGSCPLGCLPLGPRGSCFWRLDAVTGPLTFGMQRRHALNASVRDLVASKGALQG